MIVRYEDTGVIVDREALCKMTGRSPHTVRLRLEPTMRDEQGRPLYILDEAEKQLKAIPTRQRRKT